MNLMISESVTIALIMIWGTLHSIFASNSLKRLLGFDPLSQTYRIGFIIIAFLSFIILELTINIYLVPEGQTIIILLDTSKMIHNGLYYTLTLTGWFFAVGAFIQAGPLTFIGLKGEKSTKIKFDGFYRFSRHPIYFGVILVTIALLLTVSNSVLFTKYLFYIIYLIIGAKFEEKRLSELLDGYNEMFDRPFFFPYRSKHLEGLFKRKKAA